MLAVGLCWRLLDPAISSSSLLLLLDNLLLTKLLFQHTGQFAVGLCWRLLHPMASASMAASARCIGILDNHDDDDDDDV